jgi:hypothetical protein
MPILAKLGIGAGLLALAVVLLVLFGNARYHQGELAERVEWGKVSTAIAQTQAVQQREAGQRVQQAIEAWGARAEALRPIVAHNTTEVIRYAATDAGKRPCLDAGRVRDIEITAAQAGLPADPGPAGNALQPDALAAP